MPVNHIQDLMAFVDVVRQGSFAKAARNLGVSASAVTKGIARLESDLGVQLFTRSPRKVLLMDHSREFYERCVKILAALDEAETGIRDETSVTAGVVRVVMPTAFGGTTLIPHLSRFFELYPDIKLELEFSTAPVDRVKDGFDLAISTSDLADSSLVRRVLWRGPMVIVGAPSYLKKYGKPETPEDLVHHNCIVGNVGRNWTFKRDGEPFRVRIDGSLYLKTGGTYREAVLHGIGIGYSTRWLFREDISSGALVSLLENYTRDDNPISVIYNDRRHLPKKVKIVIDFLSQITRHEIIPDGLSASSSD